MQYNNFHLSFHRNINKEIISTSPLYYLIYQHNNHDNVNVWVMEFTIDVCHIFKLHSEEWLCLVTTALI